MDETLGELLRARRLAEGISLRDMAERAGVTGSYLSLLELDKRSPSIDVLAKLVEVYNLPREICEACEGKGWVTTFPPAEDDASRLGRRLDAEASRKWEGTLNLSAFDWGVEK